MSESRIVLDTGESITERVAHFVDRTVTAARLPRRRAYWLRLAAEEITTNIAHHGYGGGGGTVVLVSGSDASRVWLRIEDEAPAFDPMNYDPAPRLAVDPAERQDGGYGLLLALRHLDEFAYDRVDGHNRNTLVMWLPVHPAPSSKEEGMTLPSKVLVVAEQAGAIEELAGGLRAGGFEVEYSTPDLLVQQTEARSPPDLLLISASLGLERLAGVSQRFSRNGITPITVTFPEGDFAALERCVAAGFEYVAPPYLPDLLRSRMISHCERAHLTMTVEALAAASRLRALDIELGIAREIQAGFLPEQLSAPAGWGLAARFRPARQVGGDFYDVFELINGRRLGLAVGDVCDKGVGAALFMALIRTLLRHTAEHTGAWDVLDGDLPVVDPAAGGGAIAPLMSVGAGPLLQAVVGTNRYLTRNHPRQGYFCTLFFGVLDPATGTLLYINGGHNPAVLARADGSYMLLKPTGPAVGLVPASTYSLGYANLGPGDSLFIYTDGVVEARNVDGDMFGMERMLEVVTHPGYTSEERCAAVEQAVWDHVGSVEQFDDITMLALCHTQ